MASKESEGTYAADILDLIYKTRARIEYPDVLYRTSSAQDLLNPIHTMLGKWFKHSQALNSSSNVENTRDLLIAEIGFHNYREWLILGLCGVKLSRFTHINELITGTLCMGAAHRDIARKKTVLTDRPVRVLGEKNIVSDPRYMYLMQGIGDAALSASAIVNFQTWCANELNR